MGEAMIINAVIMWICIVGQWLIIFMNPTNALIYSIILFVIAFLSAIVDLKIFYHKEATS